MIKFCGACGAARQQADQRFCLECGAGLDALAATTAAPPASPVSPAASPQTPDYPSVPLPADRRGSFPIGRVLAATGLVLALVGGGFVGWQLFGPKGGAGSPEEAVEKFVKAAAKQDGAAMIGMVNPGEVGGLDEVYDGAMDRLENAGLTDGDTITDLVQVDLEGLEFVVDELADNAARVTLTKGRYEVTFDPGELSARLDFVSDELPDGETWTGDILGDYAAEFDEGEPVVEPFVDTVKVDGRWYVTLVGTGLDLYAQFMNAEGYWDLRSPDFDVVDEELAPITGKNPRDVLTNLADAVNDGDYEAVLANLPDDLVMGLRPFIGTFEDALVQWGASFTVSVDELDVETEEVGDDLVKVTVDRAVLSGSVSSDDSYGAGAVTADGRCFSALDFEYGDEDGYCVPGRILDLTGVDEPYFLLRRINGGYQLDPVATAIDYATTALEEAPESLVEDILRDIEDGTCRTLGEEYC